MIHFISHTAVLIINLAVPLMSDAYNHKYLQIDVYVLRVLELQRYYMITDEVR